MKDRAVWAFLAFAVLVLGGLYAFRNKPAARPAAPAPVVARPAAPSEKVSPPVPVAAAASTPVALLPPAPAPAPVPAQLVVRAGRNGEAVPIQDGKTIDMSSGRPVVRDDARSRAAIDKATKEMEEAAKDVTFGPRPAVPPAAPPKP